MGGQKAHWAVLCGCLIQSKSPLLPEHRIFKQDLKIDLLFHYRRLAKSNKIERIARSLTFPLTKAKRSHNKNYFRYSFSSSCDEVFHEQELHLLSDCKLPFKDSMENKWHEDRTNILLLYRQSKSRKLICAPLRDIYESNFQLKFYSTDQNYVIDSVEDGLSQQVVVIHKK